MKLIPLTQGQYALVDGEDFEKFSHYNWYANKSRGNFRPVGKIKRAGKTKHIYLYREIMGAKEGQEVDHINGNPLDNRKCNLRICTKAQNSQNRGIFKNKKTSPYKGVNADGNKWRVRVRQKHQGVFDTLEEAVEAYNIKSKELFGDFARVIVFKGSKQISFLSK